MTHEKHDDHVTIQAADPAARARALWLIFGFVAVVGALALASVLFEERFVPSARAIAMDLAATPQLLFFALFAMALPLIGISVYIFFQGRRIVAAQRTPYPGQKVIRDTPVIRGAPAVQRGRAVQAIAVLMGLFSLVLPFIPPLFMLYLSKGN